MSQLDPVQIAALDFAQGKQGVGWFLEQGLGKTLARPDRILVPLSDGQGRPDDRGLPEYFQERMAGRGRKARLSVRRPRLALDQEGRRRRLAEQAVTKCRPS